jgi:transmembrane sensor
MLTPIPTKMRSQIVRVLEDTATDDDRRAVQEWRERRVENDLRYRELKAIWDASPRALTAAPASRYPEERPTAAQLLANRDREPDQVASLSAKPARRPRGLRWVPRVAAIVAAALIGALWATTWTGGPTTALHAEEYVTGPDELVTATLADGTIVRLAPSSRLRVEVSDRSRDVWLDGRAFFAVSDKGDLRFVVRTNYGDATVLGTRFGVTARGNDLELAVLQGAVQVTSQAGSARVEGGQLGQVQRGAPPRVQVREDLPAHFTWMGSFIAFHDTPLSQVALEVEAVYGVRVEIEDPDLKDRVVTGWFSEDEAREVMEVVCRIVNAICSYGTGTVKLSGLADST